MKTFYRVFIMGWLFFKKVEKPAEVIAVEEFNKKLSELLTNDNYISVKDYSFLVEQFSGANKAFITINDSGLLPAYCKKNKTEPRQHQQPIPAGHKSQPGSGRL